MSLHVPVTAVTEVLPGLPVRWRLRQGRHMRYRQWDDEFVVFNDLTGDCHLLDEGGFAILGCLQQAADGISLPALAAQLALQFDDIDPADPVLIEQTMTDLVACDLIEQAV